MKLNIQLFATGGVVLNYEKEYTYEQDKKETVKITVTPDNSQTNFDFENDFDCLIDDNGWIKLGQNGSYYKVFNKNVIKTITFTYKSKTDTTYKVIGDLELNINDLHNFYNLTICVDKQPMYNPSNELKEYPLKLLQPLRNQNNISDKFILDSEGNYRVVRYLEKYLGGLRKLKEPIEESVGKLNIEFFEGDNYVYLKENGSYIMKIQYLTNSGLNKTYATKMELKSKLEQTVDGFTLTVSKKVDEDEIISTINQSSEQVKINANKISLEGKEIDLTSDNIIIKSNNFNVDQDGNMTCTSGTFGGTINTNKDMTIGDNLYVGQNQSSTSDRIKYLYFSPNGYIRRWTINGKNYMMMYSDLNTRLSCKDSGYINVMDNNISMSHNPSISSDKRLKDNIKDVDVSWINDIRIKEFEYKNNPNKKEIGIIAQDYLDKKYSKYFLNQNIANNSEKYYSVQYGNITNALIKYCQQLEERISKLEGETK